MMEAETGVMNFEDKKRITSQRTQVGLEKLKKVKQQSVLSL